MTGTEETRPQDHAATPRWRVGGFWRYGAGAALSGLILLIFLGLTGLSMPLPGLLVEVLENKANAALGGRARIAVDGAALGATSRFVPEVRLSGVTILSPAGNRLVQVNRVGTSFDAMGLMLLRVRPSALNLHGARIAVRRLPDGTLDIAPGVSGFDGGARRPADILDSIDKAFSQPALAGLSDVSMDGVQLLLDDRRSGSVLKLSNGSLRVTQDRKSLSATLTVGLVGPSVTTPAEVIVQGAGQSRPASVDRAIISVTTDKETSAAVVSADLDGVSARDFAAEVPALAWLAAVDAPISGEVRTGFDDKGALGPLTGKLTLGTGVLQPSPGARPVKFDRAQMAIAYDPARARLDLTDLSIESRSLRVKAGGTADLLGMEDGLPDKMKASIRLTDLEADPEGLFERQVAIGSGRLEATLTLRPFQLAIDRFDLVDGASHVGVKGTVGVAPKGWTVQADATVDQIESERLLALWPVAAVPKTRAWLSENVTEGRLSNVSASLNVAPGKEPDFHLGYQFEGARIRFMKTLPSIVDGAGHAEILGHSFSLTAERGRVSAPQGGDLDIAGSVLRVRDIYQKPAPMEVDLQSRSSVTAALSILDQAPFQFLTKAGQPVDLAQGQADVRAVLRFTPKPHLLPQDVSFDVTGQLLNVSSDKIVKGRVLSADRLSVTANHEKLAISGAARLDDLPLTGSWTQGLLPEDKGHSEVAGQVALNPKALKSLHIALPETALQGESPADFTVALVKGKAPTFRVTSDLGGATLAIPEVTWTKAASEKGKMVVEGELASPVKVTRFELAAAGLSAKGKIALTPDSSFDRAEFSDVALGDWFKGAVTLVGRGKGKTVGLEVKGGELDMRRATFASGKADGGDNPPISVQLDRLRMSDEIAVDRFAGQFSAAGGFNGDFAGMVNGVAPVSGSVVPGGFGRSAYRIQSADGGLALAAAHIYSSGRGGDMTVMLTPRSEAGQYDGTLSINNIRVVNAPELASLLNAISVVGLINELRGTGITFSDVSGRFILTPDAVEIDQGSAVGASLGVSGAGVYRIGEKTINIQGVISPVYMLNGIGQIFSHQRDGLFGFNYKLKGDATRMRVSVNPLSILTPGMFRDLFRKDPPKLDQ